MIVELLHTVTEISDILDTLSGCLVIVQLGRDRRDGLDMPVIRGTVTYPAAVVRHPVSRDSMLVVVAQYYHVGGCKIWIIRVNETSLTPLTPPHLHYVYTTCAIHIVLVPYIHYLCCMYTICTVCYFHVRIEYINPFCAVVAGLAGNEASW